MQKLARRSLLTGLGALLVLLVSLGCAYWASKQSPRFYRQEIAAPSAAQANGGQRLEFVALQLHNQLQHPGSWDVCLTQDEINAWLATDLPSKFPRTLPPGISQPRIAIDDECICLAVHYQRGAIDTVLSIVGEVYLTAQPNEIALRLDHARAGLIPVPMSRFLGEITERAARANLPLRWTETRGAPVAILRLSFESDSHNERHTVLDRFSASRGQIQIAGRTQSSSVPTASTQSGDSEIRQR